MNKGVSLSLQTMVIAALSILILVVLVVLFTNQAGIFSDSITSCEDQGEEYSCESSCGPDQELYQKGEGVCGGTGQVCCVEESSYIG